MSHKLFNLFTSGVLLLLLGFFTANEVYAQGKIIGHVKDKSTNEPLVGVNILILNTYMGAATDFEGDYVIVNVPVGVYSLQVSMVGTTKITKTDVVVSQNYTTRVDFELEQTALLGQEITVTAKQDILHKEISSSQIVINNQQIKEAAGVRTLQDYLATQSGITNKAYLNIRGGTASETGTLVNGVTFVNARSGKTESLIPVNSIEQVSLKAGGMSAENGNFRSGVIDVTMKSGTNDGYHGSLSFTRSLAHVKRFGLSLYDPMNNALRAHLDPDIAFIGVDAAVTAGIITAYDKQQLGVPTWKGHITQAATWNKTATNPKLTPVDDYLWDAWMHMAQVDFDKLNTSIRNLNAAGKNVGAEVTDQNLKDLFKSHENQEGQYADFSFDGGFGGPVPLIGNLLGGATFYLSNATNRTSYVQPMEQNYNISSNTMLAIKTNITEKSTLKLTGAYGYYLGTIGTRGADDELFSLGVDLGTGGNDSGLDRAAMMPENNIPMFTELGSNFDKIYWWYPTMMQPWEEKTLLLGLNFTHALSSATFYELTASYQGTKDFIDPSLSNMRDMTVLGHIGPIPINEMPYGRQILPNSATDYTVDGFKFDQYSSVPGLSERFGAKGGVLIDNSSTQQLRLKLVFGSQVSKQHFVKAGLEFFYLSLNNARYAWYPAQDFDALYEQMFRAYPRTFGAFLQDEITFEDMVINVGMRMDYYSMGSLHWPTGQPFNISAMGASPFPPANWLQILQDGGSNIWNRWDQLDADLRAQGKEPLYQPIQTHLVFSPRVGISFPVTERAKFYFNYGHFRQWGPISELLAYNVRFGKQGTYNLGNPNLAPSKTIQYELGVDYNLLDEYLIHISGYYKDITGDIRNITINDNSGTLTYDYRTDDRYRDIQGLEVQVTKATGDWLTGWVNLKYTYSSGGNTGRQLISENPATNTAPAAFYNSYPTRPDPVPMVAANLTFKAPESWGYYLGGWNLSLLPVWAQGDIFTFNPRGVEGATNELRWPDLWMINLKLSKMFDLGYIKATVYVDINNLLNRKVFLYNDAFSDGPGGTDYTNYLKSLRLPEYSDSYYDPIRDAANGYYVAGSDKVGDLRSSDKPYINDPNNEIFTYGQPREIWFGIKFDF